MNTASLAPAASDFATTEKTSTGRKPVRKPVRRRHRKWVPLPLVPEGFGSAEQHVERARSVEWTVSGQPSVGAML